MVSLPAPSVSKMPVYCCCCCCYYYLMMIVQNTQL